MNHYNITRTTKRANKKLVVLLGFLILLIASSAYGFDRMKSELKDIKEDAERSTAEVAEDQFNEDASTETDSISQEEEGKLVPIEEKNSQDSAKTQLEEEQSQSSISEASPNTTAPAPMIQSTKPAPIATPIPSPKPSVPAPAVTQPPATSAPVSAANGQSSIESIVSFINTERANAGLGSVRINSTLNSAAYAKSKDMAVNNYFAHTSPTGVGDIFFINQSGYKYRAVGMNLAKGDFKDSNALVQAWMNSEGHRKNILASFGKEIGVGIYGKYYTMFIAQPN